MEDEIQAGEDGLYCVGFKNVFALNRAQIYEAFSQYGSVKSARGSVDGTEAHRWTFVRFGNPEEAVRAITGMRASPHLCNVDYVKYVQDNRRKGQGGGQSSSSVPVADTVAAPAAGTGVSPLVRQDQPADRSPVRPPAERAPRSSSGQFEVFVGNWPATLGEDDLYGLFAKFDIKALSVRLYKKEQRSYAFVVVSTAEDVTRAVEQLNRGKVAGQQIVVKDSRDSLSKQQSPAPQKRQPQQQQQQRQQPHHHHPQQRQQQQQQAAPVSVRQRLGVPDRRAGGAAAPGPHARAAISQMPPLVLPPSEQRPPLPLSAPYRAPGGFSRGPGAPDHFSANGVPPGQYNGRQAREDVRFEREPAPVHFERQSAPVHFERQPAPVHFERQPAPAHYGSEAAVEFEPAGGAFRGGAAGPRMSAGPPPLAGLGSRRSFSQRTGTEADFSEPYVKRARFGGPELGGPGLRPSGPPPLAGMGGPPTQSASLSPHRGSNMGPPPVALRSAVAISERIKSRLHAPMDVVVANFPVGTNEHALMQLFDRFEPLNVRIMVNNSSQHPDDFTYAYVTLSSRMMADEAVMEMDGVAFQGRPLVVETRKN